MTNQTNIRERAERSVKILNLKPKRGHLTGVTKARWVDGLRCEIEEGEWKLAADMPTKVGGDETAPTPGMLGRGALASCLVLGISMWAARLGIVIDALEVEVEGDFDARGELGMGEDIPAGYKEVRYLISIESAVSTEKINELIATAQRHSPYVDVFARSLTMKSTLRFNGSDISI